MATMVINGTGKGIVTHTGANTMIGSISVLTAGAKQESTTLQLEIKNFVILIAILAVSTVTICFIVWGTWIHKVYPTYIPIAPMLVNVIAILVAFIPTGLPVAVTLSLLLVARKMARNKVLVKNLTIIETLSCVNVIASDKTGTLTQNKMFVSNASAGLTLITSNLARRASVFGVAKMELKSALQLLNSCILCNEAKFDSDNDKDKPVNERSVSGGATDAAILKYGASYMEKENVERDYQVLDKEIGIIPFNSKNKWMARVFKSKIRHEDKLNDEQLDCFELKDDECVVVLKGAPDILMKNCKFIIQDDGSETPLDDKILVNLKKIQMDWCLKVI
jgi:sodium/potassium-transporting ATPase subunit alpha